MDGKFNSLSEGINELRKEGFNLDFNMVYDGIESRELKAQWEAGDLRVVKYYRFEGMSNPDDNSILYAIETKDGKRGVLVDSYGAKGQEVSREMIKKLQIDH